MSYVKGVVTYTIMDDLTVTPTSTISIITMFDKFNAKEVGALEENVIGVGMNEVSIPFVYIAPFWGLNL